MAAETQYRRSNGEWVDIATMEYFHLKGAIGSLEKSGAQPAALEAMKARKLLMDTDYRGALAAERDDPATTDARRAAIIAELEKLGPVG